MKTIIVRIPNNIPAGTKGIVHRNAPGKLLTCVRCVPTTDSKAFVATLKSE